MRFFEQIPRTTAEPPGLLGKMVAFVVTVALIIVALMFSVLLVALITTAGVAAWGYLWWKTRALRKELREHPPGGLVIEGEVIREVQTRDPGKP